MKCINEKGLVRNMTRMPIGGGEILKTLKEKWICWEML